MKIKSKLLAATAAALATAATLAAQPASATGRATCPAGYLCLQPSSSSARPVLVEQGGSRSFPDGLQVSQVSNQTGVTYCVSGTPYGYTLGARKAVTRAHTVLSVKPAGHCAA
ncbi:hypothetical protein [Nonomuraea sp. NPDC050783]|uniref:hypothetical protein n=1 Tax=Nonomuraea sp. NPDC050783 TaxID=3154634 RepID=UPI0034670C52